MKKTLLALSTLVMLASPLATFAAPVDDAVLSLQQRWETVRYQTPANEREGEFERLSTQARALSEQFAGHSGPLVWEGIILSSWAGEKGGLGALSLVKRAKTLYEQALQIDDQALGGSAYNSLGVLYYKVPGWPLGFGDKDKARELLQKALALNPQGIDSNYFYGEYLAETGHEAEAVGFMRKALNAPGRAGREVADNGRRAEARAWLDKLGAH